MPYLPVSFFVVAGVMYIYVGWRAITQQRATITFGNQFRKETVKYIGYLAQIHGSTFIGLGVFSIVWGFAPLLGFLENSWTWVIVGVVIMVIVIWTLTVILSILNRKMNM
ncbi:MAG: hypothetical protein AAFV98_17775 [Chloroflexota bacterium]